MTTVTNIFKTYDKSNDNFMDTTELTAALNQFAKQSNKPAPQKAQIETILKKYDVNKDKKIAFDEFLKLVREVFNVVFAEGNGKAYV